VHVDELLLRERRWPRPSGTSRPAAGRRRRRSLVLGAVAVTVLFGVLGVAGALTGQDMPAPAAPTAAPENITGAKVFRPDVIKATLRGGGTGGQGGHNGAGGAPDGDNAGSGGSGGAGRAGGGQDAAGDGGGLDAAGGTEAPGRGGPDGATADAQGQPAAPGTGTTEAPGQQPPATVQQAPATTTGTATPLTPGSDPVLNTILQFYATAPSQPAIAFELLHPSVQDGTLAEFAASWQGISSAQVVGATPDGVHAMIIRVVLLRTDGTSLLTTQRIEVRGGARPRIVDAQLLSAAAG